MEFNDLAALESAEVQSEDGQFLGEVAAVHVDEGTDHVRFVEIAPVGRREHFIVPTRGAAVADQTVMVPFTAANIEHGPTVEAGQTLSVGEVSAVVVYYRVGTVKFGAQRITDRAKQELQAQGSGFIRRPLPPIIFSVGPDLERGR